MNTLKWTMWTQKCHVMCLCVCLCLSMCASFWVCMRMSEHVCLVRMSQCVAVDPCEHVCVHVCVCARSCITVCLLVRVHMCLYVCVCVWCVCLPASVCVRVSG